jgi:hypothetical protein
MKTHSLVTTALVGVCCVFLAGCAPKAAPESAPKVTPTSTIPSSVPETQKIQTDICGKLPTAKVAEITGVKVDPPVVTTIESVTGAKRHVCTYNKSGEATNVIAKTTVIFRSEVKPEVFQQLWSNQQQAQQKVMQPVSGVGTEAFIGQSGDQPVLYMLIPDAQFWIQMGQTSLSSEKQADLITKLGQTAATK